MIRNMIHTFIARPVFTTMFVLMLVVFGIRCYPELGLDMNPDVDIPIVTVRVTYEGASPEEMETLITKPIENRVSQVAGIKTLSSSVLEGFSETVLEFDQGVDPQSKAADVREKVASVRKRLPDDIDEPTVQTVDLASRPIVVLAFSSASRSRAEIRRFIEDSLKDEMQMVEGVAETNVIGASQRVMRVVCNPQKMAEYHISFQHLYDLVNAENYNTPGGKVKTHDMEITVRTMGKYNKIEDLKSLVVGNNDGRPVYLTDVCEVLDDWADETTYAELNKEGCVIVTVRKQSKTNTVQVTDAFMKRMEELKERVIPQDISYAVVADQSKYIRDNVADVWNTIIFGGFLALFVTYLFLGNLRATIIGGLCIPTSLISTFFLMKVMNFTLNNMSLMALSLAVGMLIDDAIVLIETVFRHIEKGEKPMLASENATVELALAIMATSLVLMAVFVPIGSMGEIIGEFFKQFGLTVAFAVAFSTMTAYTLTPMVAAHFIKDENQDNGSRPHFVDVCLQKFEKGFTYVRALYDDLIRLALANPVKVVIVGLISLIVNVGLVPFIGVEYQPTYDSGQFQINYKSPIGTSLYKTAELAREVEEKVMAHPEVKFASLYIGGTRNPVNNGSMMIKLKDSSERDKSMQTLMDELRGELRSIEGLTTNVTANQSSRRGDPRPVQCGLRGSDFRILKEYALQLADMIRQVPGATDVDISDSDEEPEILIRIDRSRSAEFGLDASSIGTQVEIGFLGKETGNSYTIGDHDYDVVLQMAPEERTNMEDVKNFRISTADGNFVRLGDVAEVTLGSGPTRIDREDKQRQVVVYANTVGISPGELISIIQTKLVKELNLPQGYSYKMIGEADVMKRSFTEVAKALILAVVVVYMVLAAEFESFIQPLVIMISLPFSIIGGVLGLLVSGQTANMMSMIGLTMLLGLASKNAILLIDYANQQRWERGLSIYDAVVEACSTRLRPIFMTTFSTILAMLPVAFGLGEGAELRQSMGVVIVGGLFSSTMLTLLVIPVIYLLVETYMEKRKQ